MKKILTCIIEWVFKLWRLVLYICGMVAIICGAVGIISGDLGLIIFLECMVIIMLPRICDEAFKPLLEKDDKEN